MTTFSRLHRRVVNCFLFFYVNQKIWLEASQCFVVTDGATGGFSSKPTETPQSLRKILDRLGECGVILRTKLTANDCVVFFFFILQYILASFMNVVMIECMNETLGVREGEGRITGSLIVSSAPF